MRRFAVLAACLVALGLLSGCSKSLGSGTLAVVNGEVVTDTDLNVRVQVYELFFRQVMTAPSSRQQMLDQLVKEQLILQQAKVLKVSVTDAEVESEMAKFFGALERQYQSRAEMLQKLQEKGLTNDQVASFMRSFLLSQRVLAHQRSAVTVSEGEARTFYEQNKELLYTFKEKTVHAAHILVPLDQEAKAKEIAAKAEAGGDFAELARIYSVDPGSSQVGGDLGFFTKGTMVKEFAEAAFTMKAGTVSDPVRSAFGWHIIKVMEEAGSGTLSFERALPDVQNRMLPDRQEEASAAWLALLERDAKIERAAITEKPAP
jgi:foldase protein PrsA